jgi:hypothetical protein
MMNMLSADHRRRAALSCVLALAAVGAAAPAAQAASSKASPLSTGFSVTAVGQDGIFRSAARAGKTVSGRVRVRNLRARSIVVTLSAADALTADVGGVSFPKGAPRAAGGWLTLSRTTVRLRAGSSTLVSFTARVPSVGVAAGEHYAGIVAVDAAMAKAAAAPGHRRGVSVRHLTRLALPVKLTTPGAVVHHLALDKLAFGVDASGSQLRLALRNDGTIITRATTIKLAVRRAGRLLFDVDERVGDFLPGTAISFPIAWRGRLAAGTYDVTGVIRPRHAPAIRVDQAVTFTPKLGRQLEQRSGVKALPPAGGSGPSALLWLALAAALGLAAFAATAYLRLRHRLKIHPA